MRYSFTEANYFTWAIGVSEYNSVREEKRGIIKLDFKDIEYSLYAAYSKPYPLHRTSYQCFWTKDDRPDRWPYATK